MPRAERERLILDVAGSVFAHSGYHAASMDEIAELAGVSKPMLYAYFGSKEGLYVAYIDRTGRELLDRLLAAAKREDPPAVRLRARVAEFLAFVEQYRDGWRVLFSEVTASRPLADEVAQLRGQIARAVQRMLEDPIAADRGLDEPASEAIAHAVVGAGESLANWWLAHPDTPREDVVQWYVELVHATVSARLRRGSPLSATPKETQMSDEREPQADQDPQPIEHSDAERVSGEQARELREGAEDDAAKTPSEDQSAG